MSSVLKANRKPSHFKVYDNAENIRKELNKNVVKDFAISNFPDDLTPEQIQFINSRREYVLVTVARLKSNLVKANSIYIKTEDDYMQRRKKFNTALGCCNDLIDTLQSTPETAISWDLPKYHGKPRINFNKYMNVALMIDEEITLIKGVERSDNKVAARIFVGPQLKSDD